jgi:hypothetical protein
VNIVNKLLQTCEKGGRLIWGLGGGHTASHQHTQCLKHVFIGMNNVSLL